MATSIINPFASCFGCEKKSKEEDGAVSYSSNISTGAGEGATTCDVAADDQEHHEEHVHQESDETPENQNQIVSNAVDTVTDIAIDEAKSAAIEMAVTAAMEEYVATSALPETVGAVVAEETIHNVITAAIEEYTSNMSVPTSSNVVIQEVTNAAITVAIEEHATNVAVEIAATVALECLAEGAMPGVSVMRTLIRARKAPNHSNKKKSSSNKIMKGVKIIKPVVAAAATGGKDASKGVKIMKPVVAAAATPGGKVALKVATYAIGGMVTTSVAIVKPGKITRKIVGKAAKKMFNPF